MYDVDRTTAHFDWDDVHAPAPNISVMNRANGHAHLLYGLEVPVLKKSPTCRTNKFSEKAFRYVSAIDVGLIQKLESDPNYAELICKNPLNDYWETNVWRNESYQLAELADNLDLSAFTDSRKRLPEIGLGRNCNLFDETRQFAYREIRKPVENFLFDEMYSEEDFILRCINYARNHNLFLTKLPDRECETIGKSVGKWVFAHMSPDGFFEWAERRRQKSIIIRSEKSNDRREQAIALRLRGFNQFEIAEKLNITRRQVLRLLAK